MEVLFWPVAIYFLLFLFVLPIYLLIFVCLARLRSSNRLFLTTFYSILIQHSIADILALTTYSTRLLLIFTIPDTLYNFKSFPVAAVFHNLFLWFIVIRSYGIALLTVHRFLIIVNPIQRFAHSIQRSEPWTIWMLYWIPPILFNLIFFTHKNIDFISVDNMVTVADKTVVDEETKICIAYLSASCAICVFCYIFLSKTIRARSLSKLLKREVHLAVQVFLLLAAQLVFLIVMVFINCFASRDNRDMIVFTRSFIPLVNGFLSFINPFTILFFNRDLSSRVQFVICGKMEHKKAVKVISSSKNANKAHSAEG